MFVNYIHDLFYFTTMKVSFYYGLFMILEIKFLSDHFRCPALFERQVDGRIVLP